MNTLDKRWQDWITSNLARGCAPDRIQAAMTQSGFEKDLAQRTIEACARLVMKAPCAGVLPLKTPAPSPQLDLIYEIQAALRAQLREHIGAIRNPVLMALLERTPGSRSAAARQERAEFCSALDQYWDQFMARFELALQGPLFLQANDEQFGELTVFSSTQLGLLNLASEISALLGRDCEAPWSTLKSRLDALHCQAGSTEARDEPENPQRISVALVRACEELPPAVRPHFAHEVAQGLADSLLHIYEELNAELAYRGVLPELSRTRFMHGPAPWKKVPVGNALPARAQGPQARIPTSEVAAVCKVFERLESFGGEGSVPLAALLEQLRREAAITPSGKAARSVILTLASVFSGLFCDPDLPPVARPLLARLQLPVLRLALLDQTLFVHPEHPAGKFIDRLIFAAMRCDGAACDDNPTRARLEEIVGRLAAQDSCSANTFADALATLEGHLTAAARVEQTAIAALRSHVVAVSRRAWAKRHSRRTMKPLLAAPMPMALQDFLVNVWTPLVEAALLEGAQDRETGILVAMAERICHTMTPGLPASERLSLQAELPTLIERVTIQLDTSPLPPTQWAKPLAQLVALQKQALQGFVPSLAEALAEPFGAGEDEPTRSYQHGHFALQVLTEPAYPIPMDRNAKEAVGAVRALAPGDWIALIEDDGSEVLRQIDWNDESTGVLLLTSAQEGKAVAMPRRHLVSLLIKDQARLIYSGPRFALIVRHVQTFFAEQEETTASIARGALTRVASTAASALTAEQVVAHTA
ncbi:hypothetical protein GCM10025771_13020 [Niveibacterium umoris]|uniref:DUF1631 family protein n=1 Tax=Niveibacterium umoris TaxID=1193620 RepID=A0A840BNA2_9RHOO|nr:DUF1631 family protein [Niveibacterium umoris]MBB4013142.1 hypothetical protein [Niveibacterium umoris]